MPDVYVFPGGRRDPRDHALPFSGDLHPQVLHKLLVAAPRAMTPAGARALALAAVRELREETGLIFGSLSKTIVAADLSCLRYIARAITPIGPSRRFDNRFFATFADEAIIDLSQMHESEELHDLQWLPVWDVSTLKMPEITQAVLGDLKISLESDPSLPFGSPVHMYSKGKNGFTRVRL
jgi:8-oxo-dGTP pyrophosphatase MutT (NUDIX family)